MAEEPIRKEDIIDLSGTQQSINDLIKALENLSTVMRKDLKESADVLQKSLQGINVATKEGQDKVKQASIEAENLAAQQKEQNRLDKERIQLQARLNSLNSDEAREIASLRVAIEGKNKAMKDAARLDDSAADSVNQMRARLKELTAEYNRLGPAARDQTAPAINNLSNELKKAESAIGNNTRSVGNYTQSIIGAVKNLFSFAGAAALVTKVFQEIKDAIMSTNTAINVFNTIGTVTKQLFYDLVTTGQINVQNLKGAIEIQGKFNELRIQEYKDTYQVSVINREEQAVREQAQDRTKTHAERLELLNKVRDDEHKKTLITVGDLQKELDGYERLFKQQPDNEKLFTKIFELRTKINDTYAEEDAAMRRVEALRTGFIQEEKDRQQKQYDDLMKLADEQIKINQEEADKAAKARQEADKKENDEIKQNYKDRLKWAEDYWKNLVELEKKQDSLQSDVRKLLGIKDNYNQLQVNKDLQDKQKKQIEAYDKWQIADDKERVKVKEDIEKESFQIIGNAFTQLGNLYQIQKDNELNTAGDNAQKRTEIERKYSQKQQTLAVGQALVSGAETVVEIWRKWAPINVALAYLFSALSVATTVAQVAIIKSQKFAHGGSGVLQGPGHDRGGINVGIGEAEGGEHIAITSRRMTSKYGPKMLDAVANSINQGKFFEVWANVSKEMQTDPYTKKMYNLMLNTPTVYIDSVGSTVKEYPDGRKYVIKKFFKN